MSFETAVKATSHLEHFWQTGLGALRAQDRTRIRAEDTRKITGSVDVDTALRDVEPEANRWDFGLAYQHANREKEFVYWIETHTGSDREISVVLRKVEWLRGWFNGDGAELAKFEREIVWIPSGATSFRRGTKQVKQLADKGVIYSGSLFRIRNEHPRSAA